MKIGQQLVGEGIFAEAEAEMQLAAEVAEAAAGEGAIEVGGTALPGLGVRLHQAGSILLRSAVRASPWAVLGAVVVAGVIYVVIEAQSHPEARTKPGEEYRGTALPGGAPPPLVQAPGADRGTSIEAPGAAREGSIEAPGAAGPEAVEAPSGPTTGPVRAPGVVDNPDECLRLIKAGTMHDHHIFPRQFQHDFAKLGIRIDDFTVTLPWDKHIGRGGLHITFDWNGEWSEFFARVPDVLTNAQATAWFNRALDLAIDMMGRTGLMNRRLHLYRSRRRSPVVPRRDAPPVRRRR
ncbi:putative lipoprotein DUF2380 [Micromonospora kangleipakensis]|uniref:Putative lipoprotein DUF2380 n=1 Tax=Micromonospora kangleipakensis TaxID=1077942 RepID=A0A4Q8BDY4_9ACTN|nr:TIGR02269 family lipoprotein [Micromonospora kangleipakensis]RZU76120.1 putative lipoprotein DUF2380 [Micromonospora kangleipakensis]